MSALPKLVHESPPILTLHWDERSYDAFCAEAWGLIQKHWKEAGAFRDTLELHPDHERYRNLERIGALHILVARDRNRIVGYFIVLLTRHARDREALVGSYDVLYADPRYRQYGLGIRMQKAGMKKLIELGAHILMFGEKAEHRKKRGTRGGYLERWGFRPVETMYAKIIRNPHEKGVA